MDASEFDARFWLDFFQWVVMIVIAVWVHLANRHKVTQDKIDGVREELVNKIQDNKDIATEEIGGLKDRLVEMETDLKHQPTGDQISSMNVHLEKLDGDIRTLNSELRGSREVHALTAASVQRIEEFLLRNAGGGKS